MSWKTIGSARPSPLSRLDFRSKLAILLAATFLAFLWESPILTAVLVGVVLGLCLIAGIRLPYLGHLLRLMLPFYVLVLLTHGFWNTTVGRTSLWTAPLSWPWIGGSLTLTSEGLAYGAMVIFRTLTLILVIPLVIFTTDLNALIVGLVRMGIPYKVAFVFSATLRFVPLLIDEIRSITEAQRLRGLALEEMGLLQKLRVYSRIAVPLILGSMSRSQQIEVALAARAFSGSPQRTFLHETTMKAADWLVVVTCLALVLAAVGLYVAAGIGRFSLGLP